ncbi:hypothetical protein NDU88_005290 [Pleurodeles waltl]|uniref:Reverse transcriptase domain-containing protein n=1 Tax=Pleurodeles waltl TaxID=8319 RepID=A0AAV7LRR0_PLEWA|nr:hypothetical protein NDU88_005290 [Pleurodeles waltl]
MGANTKAIVALHVDNMARVTCGPGREFTNPFLVEKHIRQGCMLVPLLFSLFMNDVADCLLDEPLGVPIIAGRRVPLLLFTDYTVLMEHTENATYKLLNRFVDYCCKMSLTINIGKMTSVVLCLTPGFKQQPLIDGVSIEAVKHCDYLGIWFAKNLHWGSHVQKSTIVVKQKAGAVLKFKHKAGARCISTIQQIYTQKAVSSALYMAEFWGVCEY